MNKKDITNKRFGRLVAKEPTNQKKHNTIVWRCECDCGNECFVPLNDLTVGLVKSCGCLARESSVARVKYMRKLREKSLIDGTDAVTLTSTPHKESKTGIRGVCPDGKKYRAYITFQGKRKYLGRYNKLEDAAKARKNAEERLWGEFFEAHPELKKENRR